MRIVITDFISLDGVTQAPGGASEDTDGGFAHGGWSMPYFDVEVMGPLIGGAMERASVLLFGRRTWEGMAAAWPDRAGDPYADRMNAIEKHVVSGTLGETEVAARWTNSHLIPADGAVDGLRALRAREGDSDILVWGSSGVARTLIAHDLVDEYQLMLEPILLGGGKSIFPRTGHARPLELVSVTQTGTGVLACTYRPVR